jgi:2-polyprenyl-3-methyl-5-hydroxy-6-metoxy-1,4-benzoquinol methylase
MNTPATAHYGWQNSRGPCSCDYIAPAIIRLIQRLKANRILDVGSGNGALCALMHSAKLEVVGTEYDKDGVEIARSSYPAIHFYNYGIQDSPSELLSMESLFDAVVSTEVVEHLFSPHLLPIYARSVLKEDGYLILSTPYHGYLKNLVLSVFDKWDVHHTPLWHGGHIKFWSRATLTRLLADNGFTVTEFHGVGRLPYLWKSMILVATKTAG